MPISMDVSSPFSNYLPAAPIIHLEYQELQGCFYEIYRYLLQKSIIACMSYPRGSIEVVVKSCTHNSIMTVRQESRNHEL